MSTATLLSPPPPKLWKFIALALLYIFRKLDVLLEWSRVSVSVTQYASSVTTADDIAAVVPQSRSFTLDTQFGQTFQQQFTSMLSSLSTA